MHIIRLPKKGDKITAIASFSFDEPHRPGARRIRILKGQHLEFRGTLNDPFTNGVFVLRAFRKDRKNTFGDASHPNRKNIYIDLDTFVDRFAIPEDLHCSSGKELDQEYRKLRKRLLRRDIEIPLK